jgi:hypothetical protein
MNYTVEWTPAAEQELAALWTSAADRGAVTAAADAIDVALQQDPLTQGESRRGPTRVLFVPPLGAYFDVDAAARTVTVWAVWRLRKRP